MNQRVSFGPFHFEASTGRLWAGAQEVKLTRKAARVLGLLIARAGTPVTKQELFSAVWQNTVVSDDALVSCIQELRRALGDEPQRPAYIQTRHRYGYQFVAGLTPGPPESPPPAAAGAAVARSIAVLPFKDLSPEQDQDYFCEGLAEELIDALTHVDGLRVAARSASFAVRAAGRGLSEIGQQLAVEALVDGSVRKSGDRLRIAVQLVEVASGFHKWSQRFERPVGDVFAIQDEIAESVATILRGATLTGRERAGLRSTHTAVTTYEYYLRGRQGQRGMRRSELEQSREMFERAIALDANYAPAWAELTMVHAVLYEWWGASAEDLALTERTSRIALDLAPQLADAHVARGFALVLHREYAQAQGHFETAIRINPNLFEAHYYYARSCFARGEVARSAELFARAAEVRQEDVQSPALAGQALRMLGREEQARAAWHESALRTVRALALNPLDVRALSLGSLALYEDGQRAEALETSRRALALYPEDSGVLINAGCLHLRLGLKEEALEILERVFGRGWGKRDWVEHDPDYDPLRADPRFQRLLAKLS
ncbi:MAG TPA: winged helix-turn-helix domain-containing protein [Steroidobacteraceae bacterium]